LLLLADADNPGLGFFLGFLGLLFLITKLLLIFIKVFLFERFKHTVTRFHIAIIFAITSAFVVAIELVALVIYCCPIRSYREQGAIFLPRRVIQRESSICFSFCLERLGIIIEKKKNHKP
jgi:hypothetical protein